MPQYKYIPLLLICYTSLTFFPSNVFYIKHVFIFMHYSEFSIYVFIKEIYEEIWPDVIDGLNKFDMKCRIMKQPSYLHPNFIPFMFSLQKNNFLPLKEEINSGFYFYINRFNYKTEKELSPSANSFKRYLKNAGYKLVFRWTPQDVFSLRFAFLASAVIVENFKGICHYPFKNLWQNHIEVAKTAWEEVQNFERFALPRLFLNLKPNELIEGTPVEKADLDIVISLN